MSRRRQYLACVVATAAALLVVQGYRSTAEDNSVVDEGVALSFVASDSPDVDSVEGLPSSQVTAGAPQKPALTAAFDPSVNAQAGNLGGDAYPLTGRPAPNSDAATRPVLMMKIDNHPRARPQVGLYLADLVFDLRAEGVTRFAAVFQSAIPDPVGPVRSSRTSDFDLLRGFDQPLYGSSGGNANVAAGLRSLPIVELTNLTRREYFRNRSRPAPHNLFVNGSELYGLAPDNVPAPKPWFRFGPRGRNLGSTAVAVTGPVTVSFRGSPVVTHTWDGSVGGWLRTQDGKPHMSIDEAQGTEIQLAPANVVVMVTDYQASPADPRSPEVRSTGDGPAVVLTDGRAVVGSWQRESATDPLALVDGNGDEVTLTFGQTWVLMAEKGQTSFVSGDRPPGWLE